MHYWIRASSSDFTGTLPQPRSGHTAVNIGKSKIVVFGGLFDKTFLRGITVYGIENKLWYQPECTGSGSGGEVGPSSRAFHVVVSIDCHMFIFGGRSGSKRLGDFWVLDTSKNMRLLYGIVTLPAALVTCHHHGILLMLQLSETVRLLCGYGGWDGKKWLSDVYVMNTTSLEWVELSVSGSLPPPRCGHIATMVEKRLLVYGGRGDLEIWSHLLLQCPKCRREV